MSDKQRSEPTARAPWTVTLGWTPDQNFGRVSAMPCRSPVAAVWGQLAAGEDPDRVAEDYQITGTEVRVLDHLRGEAAEVSDAAARRERDLLRHTLTQLVEAAQQPRTEWQRTDMVEVWDRARQVLAETTAPLYPDTRWLVLCTLEGRKSGRVTVGESRLPAAMVFGLIRAHGVEEAAIQWPQLAREELAVLVQLVADLEMEAEDDPDEAEEEPEVRP